MTRDLPKNDAALDEAERHSGRGGPDLGGQAGDTQGVSQEVDASEESVEALIAEGQDYEAQVLQGVEDATDHPGKPVPNHAAQPSRTGGRGRSAGIAASHRR